MPEINWDCPECGENLEAAEDMAGEPIECPSCGKSIWIPETVGATEEPPSRPRLHLKDEAAIHSHATQGGCPSCHVPIEEGAVICVHCGLDLRTGRRIRSSFGATEGGPSPTQHLSTSFKVLIGVASTATLVAIGLAVLLFRVHMLGEGGRASQVQPEGANSAGRSSTSAGSGSVETQQSAADRDRLKEEDALLLLKVMAGRLRYNCLRGDCVTLLGDDYTVTFRDNKVDMIRTHSVTAPFTGTILVSEFCYGKEVNVHSIETLIRLEYRDNGWDIVKILKRWPVLNGGWEDYTHDSARVWYLASKQQETSAGDSR